MIVKSPGHDIQYKHKKTLKDGEVVEWLGGSEPGEQHRGELPSFVFTSYIQDWVLEKTTTQKWQWTQTKRKIQERPAFTSQKKKWEEGGNLAKWKPFRQEPFALIEPNTTEKIATLPHLHQQRLSEELRLLGVPLFPHPSLLGWYQRRLNGEDWW